MNNRPKEYRRGWVEFYKLSFAVNPKVLIPRPETELLVDEVLKYVKDYPQSVVLDLGTGAGAIAISVAKNLPSGSPVSVMASEVSVEALKMAKKNGQLHGVAEKIEFVVSDLLNNIDQQPDVVVTNLPYIPTARIDYLDASVKDYEPHLALDGGEDGFELYRKLFQQIKEKGWKPKLIVGEIDYTHGQIAVDEGRKYFPEYQVEVATDLAFKQRILLIRQLQ